MSPSRTSILDDLAPSDKVTTDLLGSPTLASKNCTLSTFPLCTSPSRVVRAVADLPFVNVPRRLRSSSSTFIPRIPDIASRISDVKSPSTVRGEPYRMIQTTPSKGTSANTRESSSTIRFFSEGPELSLSLLGNKISRSGSWVHVLEDLG